MKKSFQHRTISQVLPPACTLFLAGLFLTSPLVAADFGDAPDGTDTFYPVASGGTPIVGQFPTLLASNGARHANLSDCWLGDLNSAPSSEADAVDASDPDGLNNLVNNDSNDDGLPVIPFYLDLSGATPTATVTVQVTVAAGAPDVPRTLNMLIDWDQSGHWENPVSGAPEWAVQNFPVNVAPGTTELLSIPITWGLGTDVSPQIFWARVTLSQTPVFTFLFPNGWDGTGSFTYGETEDYLFHPNLRHDASASPWSAPANPASGNTPASLPSISLIPGSVNVAHGTPVTVTVNLDSGSTPTSLEWAIDPAQRGASSFDTGLAQTTFGGFHTATSGTTATASSGGSLPTIGSINLTSTSDAQTPAFEEWPIRVRARWAGDHTQTQRSVVRIWHSGWSGAWAVTEHFGILENDTIATVPVGQQATALGLLASALNNYKTSNNFDSVLDLLLLKTEFEDLQTAGHITAAEETRLTGLTIEISDEINNLSPFGGVPVPIISSHQDGDTLTGIVTLEAVTDSPDIIVATFSYSLDGTNWTQVSEDLNGGNGWTAPLDTTNLSDGIVRLRVEMFNGLFGGEYEAIVWVDNSVPTPTLSSPVAGSTNAGIIPIQVDTNTSDDLTTLLELSADGTNWYTVGTDADAADGHTTLLDSGQLPAGSYSLRSTVTDAYGNTSQASWSFSVAASFHSWRNGLGIPTAVADDDLDFDGLNLGAEYTLGLSATTLEVESDYIIWEQVSGTNFQLRFTPVQFIDGMRIFVDESTDLNSWTPSLTDPDTSSEIILPVSATPRGFARVRFEEDRP